MKILFLSIPSPECSGADGGDGGTFPSLFITGGGGGGGGFPPGATGLGAKNSVSEIFDNLDFRYSLFNLSI